MKKPNIKSYLSKNLYLEALNQTKITGFFLVITSIILCSIHPFTALVTYLNRPSTQIYIADVLISNVALIILMYAVPIFIAFCGFDFLSKRKACDFYHSIPVTRQTLFCSFALAGLTWVVSSLAIGGLCSLALFSAIPNFYVLTLGSLNLILSVIVGGVLIYFATLFAISASGNKLTQLMLTLLIIFMPETTRIVLMGIADDISNITMLKLTTSTVPLVPINALFGYGSISMDAFFSFATILKTAIYAIIFAILAGVVFTKRKSELAENNAPSKFMQHVYRTSLMLPFALFFASTIATNMSRSVNAISNMLSIIIVLAILFVIYIGYELATTRNYKSAIKSTPLFSMIVAITAVFLIFTNIIAITASWYSPSAEKINYVQGLSTYSLYSNSNEYRERVASHKCYDEKIKQIVADGLERAIESKGKVFIIQESNADKETEYNTKYVTINSGLFTKTRKIIITQEDENYITNYFASQIDLNEYIFQVPEKEEVIKTEIMGAGISYNIDVPDEVKSKALDIFYEEFNSLSIDEQYKIIMSADNPKIMPVFAAADPTWVPNDFWYRINLTTLGTYESKLTTIYISPKLPKTYDYIMEYACEYQNFYEEDDVANFIKTLESVDEVEDKNTEIYMEFTIMSTSEEALSFGTIAGNANSKVTYQDCKDMVTKVQKIMQTSDKENFENLHLIKLSVDLQKFEMTQEEYDRNFISDYDMKTYIDLEFIANVAEEDIDFFKEIQQKSINK